MRRLAFVLALFPFAAFAQQQCGPAESVIEYLKDKHREAPVATMMRGPDRLIIFSTDDGTTWTLIVQRGGDFCMLAEGQGYMPIKRRDSGRGA